MSHPQGLDIQAYPASLQNFIHQEIQSGETIRWLGQPGKVSVVGLLLIVMFGAGVLIAFCGVIAAMVKSMTVFWIAATTIGILAILTIPWMRKRWRYTAYVLTNRHAMIVEQRIWFFPPVARNRSRVTCYAAEQMAQAKLTTYSDGEGKIVFETRRYRSGDGDNSIEEIGFLNIPDAAAVHALVLQSARRLGVAPEPQPVAAAEIAAEQVSLAGLKPIPFLDDPPRRVPFSIQRRLFGGHGWIIMMTVGVIFVLISLVFIIPPFFMKDVGPKRAFDYLWRLFPFIHLTVGLGLLAGPIIAWRRRVAILRHGQLAPARIIAYQDANLKGPWIPFDAATFAKAKWFTGLTPYSVSSSSEPQGTSNGIKLGVGCLFGFFGLFGFIFGVVWSGFVWFGANAAQKPLEEKLLQTLLGVGFTAVYLGIVYFMWRMVNRMLGSLSAAPTSGGMQPRANLSVVFALPEGTKVKATAAVNARSFQQKERSDSEGLAIYHPRNPMRALLLDGIWPPIEIREGYLEEPMTVHQLS